MNMTHKLIGWPMLALLLASCVTINIYFPAAAAEEAARTIVRDVLGKEGEVEQAPAQGTPQSAVDAPVAVLLAGRLLEILVPSAHAAEANIDISSPAISRLRQSMSQRQRQLDGFYRAGAVGFANDGDIVVRDISAVSLRDRTTMKTLVAQENMDRAALYREIARANGHPEWERDVRQTFARVWQQEARRGYWVQLPNGSWQQK
jgi:uncharacterized protein YdbL (DUF1318 family)